MNGQRQKGLKAFQDSSSILTRWKIVIYDTQWTESVDKNIKNKNLNNKQYWKVFPLCHRSKFYKFCKWIKTNNQLSCLLILLMKLN